MNNEKSQEKTGSTHNQIFIEEDKEFTLDEFAYLVSRAIRSVGRVNTDADEVVYSRDDVYFTVVDILNFINQRTPGELEFKQTTFQNYIVQYVSNASQKRKAQKGLIISKAQSALVIKEQTGELPTYAVNNEAVLEAIADIEANREPAEIVATPQVVLENREAVNTHIEELAQDAVRCYEKTQVIPETVTTNAAVLKRFQEIINASTEANQEVV